MVDQKGKLIIIENRNGKFVRTAPKIVGATGTPETVNGAIMQMEMFDMDRDGKMDLVISDDSGELNILYGGEGAATTATGTTAAAPTGTSFFDDLSGIVNRSFSTATGNGGTVTTTIRGSGINNGIVFTKKTLDQNIGLKLGTGATTAE